MSSVPGISSFDGGCPIAPISYLWESALARLRCQAFFHDSSTIEALLLGSNRVAIGGLGVGYTLWEHWSWPAGMGAVVVYAIWRSIVTVRAVHAWGYAERDQDPERTERDEQRVGFG